MIRRAFTMRLKPGAMKKYRYHHDNIWPELVKEIERSGIARFYTFERDPDLFLFSEILDQDAWDRLWTSDIHTKWGKLMEPLMNFKDGVVDASVLNEIFKCETNAGQSYGKAKKRGGAKPAKKKPAKTLKKSAKKSKRK